MNNLLSHCGLVDAKIGASDKDLPVPKLSNMILPEDYFLLELKVSFEKLDKSLL